MTYSSFLLILIFINDTVICSKIIIVGPKVSILFVILPYDSWFVCISGPDVVVEQKVIQLIVKVFLAIFFIVDVFIFTASFCIKFFK
jgi:hypothetical protein